MYKMNTSSENLLQQFGHNADTKFWWYDCLIFAFMMAFSTAIGIYYACFGSKQRTVNQYLMGGKKLSAGPIAISVAVGHFSAVMLTGIPADNYKFGAYFFYALFSRVLMIIPTIYLYLVVFFDLRLISIYEYLERRFDKKTRLLASFLYVMYETLYLPVVAFGSSLAFSTACGIDVRLVSTVICSICVFYTAIGGLTTVIWTDLYQFVLIIISLTLICGIGISKAGISSIWNKAVEGKRFDIFELDLDPTKRDGIWIYLIGCTIQFTGFISVSQSSVQKFLSLPTFKDSVRSTICFAFTYCVISLFCVVIALLMYEKYSDCDPLLSHQIRKHDQMVPFYVLQITGTYPGVSGLFFVALVCAGVSSMSSTLNALSGVIYKDFICTFFLSRRNETKDTIILKIIVVVLGGFTIVCVCFMDKMGDLIPLALSLIAISMGPLMGMFNLGVLCPRANAKGVFYGAICGLVFISGIVVPLRYFRYDRMVKYPSKPLSIDECDHLKNLSLVANYTKNSNNTENIKELNYLFRISPYYHTLMGTFVTMVSSLIISYMTNRNDPPVDKNLLCPLGRYLLPKENNNKASQSLLTKFKSDNQQQSVPTFVY